LPTKPEPDKNTAVASVGMGGGAFGLEGTWAHDIPGNDGKDQTLIIKGTRDADGKMHFELAQQYFSYKPMFTESTVKEEQVEICFKMVLYGDETDISPYTLTYVLRETNGVWSGQFIQSWKPSPVNVTLKKQ
jgi:hypothetical protein